MSQHSDNTVQLVMDLPKLLRRVDNDQELLQELILIFKEEFPRQLELLRGQISEGDLKQVEFTGHSLKGMLSGLSAKRAAATAMQIEEMGRGGNRTGLKVAVEELEREVEKFLAELGASTNGVDA